MFAQLSGVAEGIYLLQLDPGESRSLYEKDKAKGVDTFAELLPKLQERNWVKKSPNKESMLVITNEKFQVERIIEIPGSVSEERP